MPKMKMKKGGAQGLAIPSSLDAEDLAAEPLVDTVSLVFFSRLTHAAIASFR
jgi:hypothetical protein